MPKLSSVLSAALAAGACAAPPRSAPAPAAPIPVAQVAVQVPETAWTAQADVYLHSEGRPGTVVPRPFTRLEVLGGDVARLEVRCAVCTDTMSGWIDRADVVTDPTSPDSAADGTLAEFALAVRRAAADRRLEALRRVMAEDFTFALFGDQSLPAAFVAWEWEGYRSLEEVPALLDRGLTRTVAELWVAPPEHAREPGFRGLRLGFRRSPAGRWEWLFLVRSEG